MKGGCIVYEDGKPRMLREGVPDVRTMYFPMHAIRLHDNWYSSGLVRHRLLRHDGGEPCACRKATRCR